MFFFRGVACLFPDVEGRRAEVGVNCWAVDYTQFSKQNAFGPGFSHVCLVSFFVLSFLILSIFTRLKM